MESRIPADTLVMYDAEYGVFDPDEYGVSKGTVGLAKWRDRESGNYFVKWRGGLCCYVPAESIHVLTDDEKREFIVRYVMES